MAKEEIKAIDVVPELPSALAQFKIGEVIKSEVLSIADKKVMYWGVRSAVQTKKIRDVYNGGLIDRPFLDIVDLESGEAGMVILPTVLQSIFTKMGDSAKGRNFAILSLGKQGKNYNQYAVRELHKK